MPCVIRLPYLLFLVGVHLRVEAQVALDPDRLEEGGFAVDQFALLIGLGLVLAGAQADRQLTGKLNRDANAADRDLKLHFV